MNILRLDDFLRKLKLEASSIQLTWLLGAGMSASAKIPLAADVSRRVILFDYLCELSHNGKLTGRPWDSSNTTDMSYKDFSDFLIWYEATYESSQEDELHSQSQQNLLKRDGFSDISPDNPQCYPLLFAKMFLSQDHAHQVLTALVKRARGINLSHLALAGLMRDYPELGHTVFTTNFDDLLLKSFLTLNHTARVFGELKSSDLPVLKPTYPQIVHLHGRHTGYRLVNTQDQLRHVDANLRAGFIEHLRGSHLIVLGYSGWDDMVMNVLKEWRNDDSILRGLFWVPYQSEKRILEPVVSFLDECPNGRAHVIVNDERNLTADSFMLSLCKAINRKQGGFAHYRNDLLNVALKQHSFTLDQLQEHPDEDPQLSVEIAKNAIKNLLQGAKAEDILAQLTLAQSRLAPDVPELIRGKAQLYIGTVELMMGRYEEAIATLESALLLWNSDNLVEDVILSRIRTLMAIGFCQLRLQRFNTARERFAAAVSAADKTGRTKEKAKALVASGMAYLALDPNLARVQFINGLQGISKNGRHSHAEALRLSGYADFFTTNPNETDEKLKRGEKKLREAAAAFEKLGDHLECGYALKDLARLLINQNIDEAEQVLARSEQMLQLAESQIGLALTAITRGDLFVKRKAYTDAIASYEPSIKILRQHKMSRTADEVMIDLLVARVLDAISKGDAVSCNKLIEELQALPLRDELPSRQKHAIEFVKSQMPLLNKGDLNG